MEVKIGVSDSPRELVVSSAQTPEEVQSLVDAALEKSSTLVLQDDKGRRYIVPAGRIAYVEIAPSEVRRVGFGVG